MSDYAWTPHIGDVYLADFGGQEHRILVRRVARDQTWADIRVTQLDTNAVWTKRQPLDDGRFPYPVRNLARVSGLDAD